MTTTTYAADSTALLIVDSYNDCISEGGKLHEATKSLAAAIIPLDFDGRPTDHAVVLAWMPAVAVYFRDPDGHPLEYVAMLPDGPRAEHGVLR